MVTVAILLTVYNRKQEALETLRACLGEIDGMKADDNLSFTVYMLNDASTDGMAEVVSQTFPQVRIVEGAGYLYWNRGMRQVWEEAAREDYDFYLWLRLGTRLRPGALSTLMETSHFLRHKALLVGTAAVAGDVPYAGGRTRKNRLIEPDPAIPVPCYTFNGYLVLVPKAVFRVLGNLDPFYRHNFGDYDYGVRAMKAGISRVVAPGILADYYGKRELPRWRDAAYSLKERYAFMLSPLGRPPQEQFHYDCRSMGFFGAVWHFITQNLSVLFPKRADRSLTNNS